MFVKEGEVANVEAAMDDADRWKEQCDQLEKRVASMRTWQKLFQAMKRKWRV